MDVVIRSHGFDVIKLHPFVQFHFWQIGERSVHPLTERSIRCEGHFAKDILRHADFCKQESPQLRHRDRLATLHGIKDSFEEGDRKPFRQIFVCFLLVNQHLRDGSKHLFCRFVCLIQQGGRDKVSRQ